jgi:8-oxo-dGTP diphosphatase
MLYAAVAIIFNKDNKILVVKRSKNVDTFPGHWCFPGGGADKGETAEECAIREVFEETKLKLKKDKLTYIYTVTKDEDKDIHFFVTNHWKGEVEIDWESVDFRWVEAKELEKLRFIPTPQILFTLLNMWSEKYTE